jgi:hypothetical protein
MRQSLHAHFNTFFVLQPFPHTLQIFLFKHFPGDISH